MLYGALGILLSFIYLFSISTSCRKNTRLIGFFLLILSISLISGIRWATGTDWDTYLSFYDSGGSLHDYMSYWHFEPGFKFVTWFFHATGAGYSLWLFVLTFSVLSIKFASIYRRPYVLICFLVLFGASMSDLFPTRQSLAISLIILSVHYLLKRDYWLYAACIILACSFHVTSCIFFLAPAILYFSYQTLFVFTLFAGLAFKLYAFTFVSALATSFHLEDLLLQSDMYSATISGRVSLISLAGKAVVILFSMVAMSKCRSYLTKYECASVKLTIFGLVSSAILESTSQIFNRLTEYFVSFEIVAVSSLVYFFTRYLLAERRLIGAFVCFVSTCLFCFTRFTGLLMNYTDLYYPFETVFQANHRALY